MPRKKGTALNLLRKNMPAKKQLAIAEFGILVKNPQWELAKFLRDYLVENYRREPRISDGECAEVGPNSVWFGTKKMAAGLKDLVWLKFMTAVIKKDPKFFEQMAEVIRLSKDVWRYSYEDKKDRVIPRDQELFKILKAIYALEERSRAINKEAKPVVRPYDIWKELKGEFSLELIRERLSLYEISGIHSRAGRPKKTRRRTTHAPLKELNTSARAYKPVQKPVNIF